MTSDLCSRWRCRLLSPVRLLRALWSGGPPPRRRLARRLLLEPLEPRLTPSSSFSVGDATFNLAAGAAGLTVTRTGDLEPAALVLYTLTDGTALRGTNYTGSQSGSVLMPAGAGTQTVPFSVLSNNFPEASRDFTVDVTAVVSPMPTFGTEQSFSTTGNPITPVTADINGDGKVDLIVANEVTSKVSVYLNTTPPGAATPTFAAPTLFATGLNPHGLYVADLNGDGRPDIVTANSNANRVSVFLNNTSPGASTASFAAQATFTVGRNPFAVAAADVNGDGRPDLAVLNYTDHTVSVLLNNTAPGAAAPSFAAQVPFTVGTKPQSIRVADLNGDGRPDFVTANYGSSSVSVLLNTTAPGGAVPTFTQQSFAVGARPVDVTVADLNGDGRPDLATANFAANTVAVLVSTTAPGSATASFAPVQTFAAGTTPSTIVARDLNDDGRPDLLVGDTGGTNGSVTALVNYTTPGSSTLSFTPPQIRSSGSPSSLTTADLNGDGLPDYIYADFFKNKLEVALNTTSLPPQRVSFSPRATFGLGTGSSLIDMGKADLNGDGKPDLVVTSSGSASASVLLNTTAPGATTPSLATAATFATAANPQGVTAADVNGDGQPDLILTDVSAGAEVLLNTTAPGASTPSFAPPQTFAAGPGAAGVTSADVNGDGRPDLLVADSANGSVAVLLNTTAPGAATPSFAAGQTFAVGSGPVALAVADVNGDGLPDLLVANSSAGTVSVLLNTTAPGAATPSFAPQQTFAVGSRPVALATADVNGDGLPDLLVANYTAGTVSVLLNTTAPGAATPSFATAQTFSSGQGADSVAAADVTGDGKPDLLVGNYIAGTVSVLVNTTAPGATTPSFASAVSSKVGYGLSSVLTADLNGDGRPDFVATDSEEDAVSVSLNVPPTYAITTGTATLIGAPVVSSITRASADPTNAASVLFTVTFSKPVSGVTAANFSLSGSGTAGAAIGTPTSSDGGTTWSIPVATGGSGTLGLDLSNRAGIKDSDGNQLYTSTSDNGSTFTTFTGPQYTVDVTPPNASIDSSPPSVTNSSNASFSFSGSDPTVNGVSSGVDHLETSLDGAAFATATGPQTFTGLAEGSHTFQVRAVDNAGNIGSAASYTWQIDLTAPTASITAQPADPTNSTSATFAFSGSDPTVNGVSSGVDHLETSLDGAAFATATGPQTFTGLAEGSHTFQVRAVDNAGNVGSATSDTWVVDLTAPAATIDSGPPSATNSISATFAFSGSDPTSGGVSSGVSRLETSLDGAAFATAAGPQTFTGLAEGSHTFQVRAVDSAGNVGSAVSYTWQIDLTAPTASITAQPADPTNSTSATFAFSGSDPTANGVSSGVDHLETSLDGAAFVAAAGPQTFTGLAEGSHTFQVRAVDSAGNVGSSTSYTWVVDIPVPPVQGSPPTPMPTPTPDPAPTPAPTPVPPALQGKPFVSVAFGPFGEALEVVSGDGVWTQYDALGAHVVMGGVHSASVAYGPHGTVCVVVLLDGTLILGDPTGSHVLGGGVHSARVSLDPSGEVEFSIVLEDGRLVLNGPSGSRVVDGGLADASSTHDALGRAALDFVLGDGSLMQIDPSGAYPVLAGVLSASSAFDPSGHGVLDVIFQDGSLVQFDHAGTHLFDVL